MHSQEPSTKLEDDMIIYYLDVVIIRIWMFQKAIAAIKEHVKQPVFFFFSDDINWVKNNIICNDECYFEDNCNPIWECLRLMYSCKHFIISNSTFSWWGQYLSRNENKLVVAPSIWYNIENETAHLLEDNWIKIDI